MVEESLDIMDYNRIREIIVARYNLENCNENSLRKKLEKLENSQRQLVNIDLDNKNVEDIVNKLLIVRIAEEIEIE